MAEEGSAADAWEVVGRASFRVQNRLDRAGPRSPKKPSPRLPFLFSDSINPYIESKSKSSPTPNDGSLLRRRLRILYRRKDIHKWMSRVGFPSSSSSYIAIRSLY